jgi:hypothetical protein
MEAEEVTQLRGWRSYICEARELMVIRRKFKQLTGFEPTSQAMSSKR